MTERQKQIAISKIKDDPEMYAQWEEADKTKREFMLYLVLTTEEQLNELYKFLMEKAVKY